MQADLRHRHFVATGVMALLMLAASLLNGAATIFASDEDLQGDGWIVAAQGDVASVMAAGSFSLEQGGIARLADEGNIVLRRGTIHVRSPALLRVTTEFGDVLMSGADCVVMVSEDAITVVAVSGTAFATTPTGLRAVFSGHQLRVTSSGTVRDTVVPGAWMQSEQVVLAGLPTSADPTEQDAESVDPLRRLTWLLSGDLVLTVPDIERAVALGRQIDPQYGEFLVMFSFLEKNTRLDADASATVVRSFFRSASVSGLDGLAFIPAYIVGERTALLSDVPVLWSDAVKRVALSDPERAVPLLTSGAQTLGDLYETLGYPKQAMNWREAVASAAALLPVPVLPEQQAVHPQSVIAAPASASSSVPAAPARRFDDSALLASARSFLARRHVLQGPGTSLEVVKDSDAVRIEGVFIPEKGRDVPYSFTVDVARGQVIEIVRDGRNLPNAVPVKQFFGS